MPSKQVTNTKGYETSLKQTTKHKDTDMKVATWNVQRAQRSPSLQRWANILQLVKDCDILLSRVST